MSPSPNNSTTALRLDNLEKEMPQKLDIAEYNLQMKSMENTNIRLEDSLNKLIIQVSLLQEKLVDQELKAEQRAAAQQKVLSDMQTEQAKAIAQLQFKIISWLLSIVAIVIGGYLTWYFTHPH